jgi:hypothetical protein
MGAEHGEAWPARVSSDAADGGGGAADCGRCGAAAEPLTLRAFGANQAPPTPLSPSSAMMPFSWSDVPKQSHGYSQFATPSDLKNDRSFRIEINSEVINAVLYVLNLPSSICSRPTGIFIS